MLPIIRQANTVGDGHHGAFQEDNSQDKKRAQYFREAVDEPERRLHERVKNVGPWQVFIVNERQDRYENQSEPEAQPVVQAERRLTLVTSANILMRV